MTVDWGRAQVSTLGHGNGCGLGRAQVSTLGHGNDCGLGKGTSEHFGTLQWMFTGRGGGGVST